MRQWVEIGEKTIAVTLLWLIYQELFILIYYSFQEALVVGVSQQNLIYDFSVHFCCIPDEKVARSPEVVERKVVVASSSSILTQDFDLGKHQALNKKLLDQKHNKSLQ